MTPTLRESVIERLDEDYINAAVRLVVDAINDGALRRDLPGTLDLLARVSAAKWHPPVPDATAALAAMPTEEHWFNAGLAYVQAGELALAELVLTEGLRLVPAAHGLRLELSACLELQGRYGRADGVLEAAESTPHVQYLRAFYGVMQRQMQRARAAAGDDALDPVHRARLGRMLARFDALNPGDARDWVAVQTGALCLAPPAASIEETWQDVGACVSGLHAWFRHLERAPTQVLHPNDPLSEGLARLIAARLDLPLLHWSSEHTEGLVVVHRLADLVPERLPTLRRTDLHLYAHHAARGTEHPVTPDVIGIYAQSIRPPWEEEADGPFGGDGEPPEAGAWDAEVEAHAAPPGVQALLERTTDAVPGPHHDDRLWANAG